MAKDSFVGLKILKNYGIALLFFILVIIFAMGILLGKVF